MGFPTQIIALVVIDFSYPCHIRPRPDRQWQCEFLLATMKSIPLTRRLARTPLYYDALMLHLSNSQDEDSDADESVELSRWGYSSMPMCLKLPSFEIDVATGLTFLTVDVRECVPCWHDISLGFACSLNEDFGRSNQPFRVSFRRSFHRFVAQIRYSHPPKGPRKSAFSSLVHPSKIFVWGAWSCYKENVWLLACISLMCCVL